MSPSVRVSVRESFRETYRFITSHSFRHNKINNQCFHHFKGLLQLVILPVVITGLTVYFLFIRGYYETTFGWKTNVLMKVSTLDGSADLQLNEELGEGQAIVWEVSGFSSYMDRISLKNTNAVGRFEKFHTKRLERLDTNGNGFWIFSFDPGSEESFNSSTLPVLRASQVTQSVINSYRLSAVPLLDLEVAVAVRAYVDGEAKLIVTSQDSISKQEQVQEIGKEVFKGRGFCFKILEIPFDKRIDMIQIQPVCSENRLCIAVVDKMIIVVAKRDVTQNIMHTLVPLNWC